MHRQTRQYEYAANQMRIQTMTKKSSGTPTGANHHYNSSSDAQHVSMPGTGKLDVIVPAHLPDFGTGAARALLHLIVEVHRKRATENNQFAEDT
jgi:hypothetical protein